MAQQLQQDEAGNVWDTSGPTPVFVRAAGGQGGGSVIGPNPIQAQRQQAQLGGEQLGNRRTAQQIALDAAKVPYADQVAGNDAARSAYERDKARFDVTGQQQGRNFERADKLRADYEALPSVKSYTQALPVFGAGLQSKADAAGDLNLIYAYAKVMDPNSVVREGEQASVAGGDTWINAKTAQLQKQLGQGGTFKPEYRKRLREEMAGRMGEMNQSFIADRVRYKGISDRYGVNPQDVVGEHPGARFQEVSERVLGRKQQQLDYNGMPIATGGSRTERDDKASKLIDTLVRGGASVEEINSALAPMGMQPVQQEQYDAVKRYLAANPEYKGSFGEATRETPNSLATRFAGSPAGTFAGSASDALFGGLLDEGAGVVQSAFNGQPISENIDRLNKAKQAAFGQNPKSALAGQITGQISQLVGAGALAKGAGLGAGLIPQLGLDAGLSAVSGAGQNNDSRFMGAAVGGTTGLVGSAAGRGLASGVGALARTQPGLAALNKTRGLFGARMAPIQPAQALSPAEGALATPLAGSADDVTAALQRAESLNTPFTLADTTPALGELAGASARRSPQALNLAEDVLGRRSRGQIDRLGASVETNLGPIGNTLELSKALRQKAQTEAGPLYDISNAQSVPNSPELEGLLGTPFGRSAIGKAETIAANERMPTREMGFSVDDAGQPVLNPQPNDLMAKNLFARQELDAAQEAYKAARSSPGSMEAAQNRLLKAREALRSTQGAVDAAPDPSAVASMPTYNMQTLDYAKRGMDDVLEQYRNPTTQRLELSDAGRAQNLVKNQFLSEADKLNPAYRDARRVYQGPMESIDALHRGQDFYSPNINANQIASSVSEQTPEHLGQMQLGYRDALMDRANKTGFSSNPWNATLGNPASESKLSTMYPGSEGPATMFAQRDLENQMARTATRVVGGSQTAGRQVADQSFLPGAAASGAIDIATAASGGVPVASLARMAASSKLGDALRLGLGKKAEAKATELAPLLLNDSPEANLALVRQILDKNQAYQKFVTQTTPKRSGGIFGAAMLSGAADRYVN